MNSRAIPQLLKQAWKEWNDDKAPRLGADLAYYTMFSLAPLLLIALSVAGMVFGEEAARGAIAEQISRTVGPAAATTIQDMVSHAGKSGSGAAAIIGVVTLLLGASGVFGQLQEAMNTIWDVGPKPNKGLLGILKDRFLSFTMVLGTCFMLLVSLLASAAISGLAGFIGGGAEPVLHVLEAAMSLAVITVLFAMLFKFLPDVKVAWKDVWLGAFLTAVLFVAGKFALGMYLGRSGVASAYGAAGSVIVILLWVYYAAQILFFGAEVTKVYSKARIEHAIAEPNRNRMSDP